MKKGSITIDFYELEEGDRDNIDNLRLPFQVADSMAISNKDFIIDVTNIRVGNKCRNKGLGSKMLETLFAKNNDDIILIGAGALISEYPDEPTDEQYVELFDNLTRFYNRNGFQDVTDLFGTYDGSTKRTFIKTNNAGTESIKQREAEVEEFEKERKQ